MGRQVDLVIVGSGPAGMTAAIYASRAGLETVIVESGAPGGKLIKTYDIQNYPGIEQSSGVDLAMIMHKHSLNFGAKYEYGNVVEIQDGEWKKVIMEDGSFIEAKAVIIATGTKERLLNIPGEEKNSGKGVSYCAVCDGAFFKDKVVSVIGGGNSALEEAVYLSTMAKKVYVIIRRDVFRADEIAQRHVLETENIEIIRKHVPVEIQDNGDKVTALVLENVDTKEKQVIETDGIFPYIGADPISSMAKDLGVLDEKGYFIVDEYMQTKVKGIYACGDVIDKHLRQVVTATNDGAIAAQHVFHTLKLS